MRTILLLSTCLLIAVTLATGGCGGSGSSSPITVTLVAVAAETGNVTSVGAVTTSGDVDAGDMTNGRGLRGFASFDLSPIPANATVLSATLTLRQYFVGGSPYTKLGNLLADHVVYGSVLDSGAYGRSGISTGFAVVSTDATLGPRSIVVTAQVQIDVAAGHPQSQYRVRFPIENSGDITEDFVDCYGGATADASLRPILVVTYR